MSEPLVSLLVPIYNVEKYLRQCLDSARNQTLEDIEVICINDGSTDSSPSIIREYMAEDPRFRMIDKPNSGYGASMNKGLDAAQGKYIAILESDDYFELDALEKLYQAAETHDAEVVKANFWFYWSKPEERNESFELVTSDMAGHLVNPQIETEIFYLKPSIWSALYRRDFLKDNGIRFLETPGASFQDSSFNFKVWATATKAYYIQDEILHYRQDNESSSINSPSKVYCVCDEYAEMDRFLASRPEKASRKAVEEKMKYDTYMWNYERLTEPLRRQFIVRFAEEFQRDIESQYVDLDIFDPWKKDDLAVILTDPILFHAQRESPEEEGYGKKLVRFYHIGGPSLVLRALWRKIRR